MTEHHEMAERLRRAMQGRTQASLAEAIGVATSTINGYLKGKMPPADVALRICAELRIDIEWYLQGRSRERPPGQGEGVEQVPFINDHDSALVYPSGLLRMMDVPLDSLCCFVVGGNMMHPTLPSGTELLLTRSFGEIVDGRVYVVQWGQGWAARRIRMSPGGQLFAVCDNPAGGRPGGDEVQRSDIAALALWAGHEV